MFIIFYFISESVKLNDILKFIRKEIEHIEKIKVLLDGKMIKGTVLGFNAKFFCRFCKIILSDSLIEGSENHHLMQTNLKKDIENGSKWSYPGLPQNIYVDTLNF